MAIDSATTGSPLGAGVDGNAGAAPDPRLTDQLFQFARDLNRAYRDAHERAERLEQVLDELEQSYLATVKTLAFVVEAKDAQTRSHLDRAHDYAVALAKRVAPELADDQVLRFGFLLHDIGKVGIPETILRKEGPLSDEEWEVMKTHPVLGAQILKPVQFLAPAAAIVVAHHERWDGGGYPRGLAGEAIPLPARIFSIVDTFDAMTADRPYRRAIPVERALGEILAQRGKQFDPDFAREFVTLCEEGALPAAAREAGSERMRPVLLAGPRGEQGGSPSRRPA